MKLFKVSTREDNMDDGSPTPNPTGKDGNEPYAVIASSFFHYELCKLLVRQGMLTPQDAAAIFNGTANNIRVLLTEFDMEHKVEAIASTYERYSTAILRESSLNHSKSNN